ncbi:MAG: lysylphosphatidylglycerol synthase transmembrane domain-containing protein [Actinomycetota bacterium]
MAEGDKRRGRKAWRYVSFAVSILIVVGIFVYAIPKFADYSAVWASIRSLTPLELATLVAATIFNLFTYWWANMAALPGLTLWQSTVSTQTTTSVANTLPGGGAIAVGLTYTILRSWGFSGTDIALYVGVSGIWNIFIKLALPVLSIVFLVIQGRSSAAFVSAALIGLAVLAGAVALLAGVFTSEALARRVGNGLGRVLSTLRRVFRRPPVTDVGERAVRFRSDTITLVGRRWLALTWTTLLSHLALYFILLLSLRHLGISEQEVSAAEVFAVFAFGRLISALPITPGGLGVIELGYIGGLVAAAGGDKPAIVAAVLLFRTLTFGIQIPLGGFTYLIWRSNKSWRRRAPDEDEAQTSAIASG